MMADACLVRDLTRRVVAGTMFERTTSFTNISNITRTTALTYNSHAI